MIDSFTYKGFYFPFMIVFWHDYYKKTIDGDNLLFADFNSKKDFYVIEKHTLHEFLRTKHIFSVDIWKKIDERVSPEYCHRGSVLANSYQDCVDYIANN